MKLTVSALFVVGIVLCFFGNQVNGSLESEWTPILTKMKDTADDIGDRSIDLLIQIARKGDKDLAANNREQLLKDMKVVQKLTMNIMKHIDNQQLKRAFAQRLAALIPVVQQVQQGGDLSVLADHFTKSASDIGNTL